MRVLCAFDSALPAYSALRSKVAHLGDNKEGSAGGNIEKEKPTTLAKLAHLLFFLLFLVLFCIFLSCEKTAQRGDSATQKYNREGYKPKSTAGDQTAPPCAPPRGADY
jgi:hypothetical protein